MMMRAHILALSSVEHVSWLRRLVVAAEEVMVLETLLSTELLGLEAYTTPICLGGHSYE